MSSSTDNLHSSWLSRFPLSSNAKREACAGAISPYPKVEQSKQAKMNESVITNVCLLAKGHLNGKLEWHADIYTADLKLDQLNMTHVPVFWCGVCSITILVINDKVKQNRVFKSTAQFTWRNTKLTQTQDLDWKHLTPFKAMMCYFTFVFMFSLKLWKKCRLQV